MSNQIKISERVRAWVSSEIERTGTSRREIANALGLAPSGVTRLLNGDRSISTEEAIRLAYLFGSPDGLLSIMMEDFPDLTLVKKSGDKQELEVEEAVSKVKKVSNVALQKAMKGHTMVLSTDLGDETCDLYIEDRMISRIPTPNSLQNRVGVIAVIMRGDIMSPMVRDGDPVFLIPLEDWSDDDHLLFCESATPDENGRRPVYIGLLRNADPDAHVLTIEHLSSGKRRKIEIWRMIAIWRVATQSELFPL